MNDYVKDLLIENAKISLPQDLMALRDGNRTEGVPTILTDGLNELVLIAAIKQPKKILELGTATGCSGIALLKTVGDAVLYTIESRENSYLKARENFKAFGVSDRVFQFLGDAEVEIDKVGDGFDFVFLDCFGATRCRCSSHCFECERCR